MNDRMLRERLLRLERSLPVADPPSFSGSTVGRRTVSVRPDSSVLRMLVAAGALAMVIAVGLALVLPRVPGSMTGGAGPAATPDRTARYLVRSTTRIDDVMPICLAIEIHPGAVGDRAEGWWWTTMSSCAAAASQPTFEHVTVAEVPLAPTAALPARTGYRLSFHVQAIPAGSRRIETLLDPAVIDAPGGNWVSMKDRSEIPTPAGDAPTPDVPAP